MALLLTARELGHAFGARALFDAVSFTVQEGDRIGLIGPNGAGKSTLLKILAGQLTPDHGEFVGRGGLRVGYLAQSPHFPDGGGVREAVALGAAGDPESEARVDELLSRLDLSGPEVGAEAPVATLSGGWQKRVALARELVTAPDLLLLDEPTNHLDVESILWLERFLGSASCATITVTHDRYFLQRVARRILELDRRNAGGLLEVDGDYATYLERKAEAMQAQERSEQALRNTLRRETEWLRRGPKARTTKSRSRIERAGKLADEVAELSARNVVGRADIELEATGRRTKRLIDAEGIEKRYGDRVVFEPLDLVLGPGSRLALLGPNGCGKSTLLRVLTAREAPDAGTVTHAQGLRVCVFEQNRESLDPEATLAESVSPDSDMVDFGGGRLHRHGYLQRFLFRPDQMRTQVKNLSGGEQSRLLIARLMLQPADILVLDEPTNDLDFETLDVLQRALERFEGSVLLVSHDRYFVDQVATRILAFHTAPDERGHTTYLADLYQWEAFHRDQGKQRSGARRAEKRPAPAPSRGEGGGKKRRLTYKDQRDWDTLEARILEAEERLAALEQEASLPEVVSDGQRLLALTGEMAPLRADIERMYERWAELEAKQV